MREYCFIIMEFLTVATILKPQGIRGEVKVKVFLDDAHTLTKLVRVFIQGVSYTVMYVRTQGEFVYLALKGVADRNAAEALRGWDVEALRAELPDLPEGRYYIGDLIGCKVVYKSGADVGEVVSVTPARTDIFYLVTPSGEISFAAAEGVILDVDVNKKLITVDEKRFKEVSV